ncbi:TrmB family transcriptional regulator [Halosimplex rubrum]|uniref:TrmB family transcriptional regulator n=1 Tax=Halosimplex rubrum TaxID=869889 RepID=A0A7D5P9Q2_9EURY|nr:TrmB family transcriptional regulator sugar-binding domain-containing protein [Halosimplex rubrum]QLH77159.1 TrmB family transcriptional regulator [Halosimplex rubrum]
MDSDDAALREQLRVFGLSDNEINTYFALLELGEATTSAVADEAGVTQRSVYNIVERLEARGLVRVNDHASPTTIRALPPREAMADISERIDAMTPELEERFTETRPRTSEIEMAKSRRKALKNLREDIESAESEVLVSVPADVVPEIGEALRAARERGALVLLLVGEVADVGGAADRYADLATAVRCWGGEMAFAYAADDERAMIGSPEVFDGAYFEEGVVWVSEWGLTGAVIATFLGAYWPFPREVHVADPVELPATFEWFRRATFAAARHREAGAELRAAIETESGERIEGRVREVRQALVDPVTNEFTLENSLVVDTGERSVSVGAPGGYLEDYRGTSVRLRPVED